jgi:3-mercaptopyruvate sulfurtransferase SseA
VFVLRLLGYENTKNYDGSMGEWANRDDTPLEI